MNKMNVLWTKQKMNKLINKSTVTGHAHASGDGCSAPGRCCRLCGGDNSLRNFGDTYIWEGVEERYDQLLYDCFGVTVSSSDCLICGWCVRQLKNTEQFRALVHAAFEKPPSGSTSKTKYSLLVHKKPSTDRTYTVADKELPKVTFASPRRPHPSSKNRNFKRPSALKQGGDLKRVNITCAICHQRYPMLVPEEGCDKFICSRCKKNSVKTGLCRRCNLAIPTNMMKKHLELHVKADLRANNRLRNHRKTQLRKESSVKTGLLPKYKCSQCSKKFDIGLNLMNHIKLVHGDSLKCICAVCGKEFKNKTKLNVHLKEHTGLIFQCRNCMTAFKSNRALQTHSYRCRLS